MFTNPNEIHNEEPQEEDEIDDAAFIVTRGNNRNQLRNTDGGDTFG